MESEASVGQNLLLRVSFSFPFPTDLSCLFIFPFFLHSSLASGWGTFTDFAEILKPPCTNSSLQNTKLSLTGSEYRATDTSFQWCEPYFVLVVNLGNRAESSRFPKMGGPQTASRKATSQHLIKNGCYLLSVWTSRAFSAAWSCSSSELFRFSSSA